jgi:adenylate cyclase
MKFHLRILENNQQCFEGDFGKALMIGRQQKDEAAPYAVTDNGSRLVIASWWDIYIGRKQLQIEPMSDGAVEIRNLHKEVALKLTPGDALAPGATTRVRVPVSLSVGRHVIEVHPISVQNPADGPSEEELNSLNAATISPGRRGWAAVPLEQDALKRLDASASASADVEGVIRGIQTTTSLLQAATDRKTLFQSGIRSLVDLLSFSRARVLFWNGSVWYVPSENEDPTGTGNFAPSTNVLENMRMQKKPFWRNGKGSQASVDNDSAPSLEGIDAVIAVPLLDERDEVVGALYADRPLIRGGKMRDITPLEAMLVELIACDVSAGMARLARNQQNSELKAKFQMFFTPQLAEEMERDPSLLSGREADVTILFCDVRGFSRASEMLSASQVFELINDLMETLSRCVLNHGGTLVDYIGDELMAMWGAPKPQPDHALRACRAALDMLTVLPEATARWANVLQTPLDVGIGLNTGQVRAGNTGSRLKFKYGPLGHVVNLASRVQGATKYLHARALVTGSTWAQLPPNFPGRKLCDVRVVNIQQPVAMHELFSPAQTDWQELKGEYESALAQFEGGKYRSAALGLGNLLNRFPDDHAAVVLMSRNVSAMVEGAAPNHPVWELPGK